MGDSKLSINVSSLSFIILSRGGSDGCLTDEYQC